MKFGVSFLPDASPETKSAADYFDDVIDISVEADRLGFEYVKMTEHYLNQYGGYCPSPLAFLAAVASRTSSIRLMTGCLIPALHHPIALAAETAMLDQLSHGRLDVGFARGYMPYEFEAFGIDMDESRNRFEETIELVKKLWTEHEVTFEGDYFSALHAHSWPKPFTKPTPHIWGAAVRSRQSFAWLGEQSANLLINPGFAPLEETAEHVDVYRSARVEDGDGDRGLVLASIPLLITRDPTEATELGAEYLREYFEVWARAADSWEGMSSTAYRGYTGMARGLRATNPAALIAAGGAIVGDVQMCTAQIRNFLDVVDVDGILWQLDFGSAPRDLMFQSLRLFAGDVRPILDQERTPDIVKVM